MAQAHLAPLAPAPDAASEIELRASAFALALAAVTAAYSTHGDNRAVSAESGKLATAAERVCAWAAFDCARLADEPTTVAEALISNMATAKGVKPEGLPVYRQRARDMVAYGDLIAPLGRDKKSPLTIAKAMRQEASDAKDRIAAQGVHYVPAGEMVAAKLGITLGEVFAGKDTDPLIKAAFEGALETRLGRSQTLASAYALRSILKDCDQEMRDAVGAIFLTL